MLRIMLRATVMLIYEYSDAFVDLFRLLGTKGLRR